LALSPAAVEALPFDVPQRDPREAVLAGTRVWADPRPFPEPAQAVTA